MADLTLNRILVIGASGLVGKQLTKSLLADGYAVRCLARNPARTEDLASAGCEVVPGDICDLSSVERAVDSVQAVYLCIHTLSPQPGGGVGARFMEVEKNGIQNVVTACQSRGVRRVIYLTSLGISPDEPSEWLRERWHAEELLLGSGLDATILRPGCIVGVGGHGFDGIVGNARRRVSIALGGDHPQMRTIALDDLVYYLTGVIAEPRAYGQRYDVGSDDVLSISEMIDATADVLGRRHPVKRHIPLGLMRAFAPLIERAAKLPTGAMSGFADALKVDSIGNPMPIRALLPRPLLTFRQAAKQALAIP